MNHDPCDHNWQFYSGAYGCGYQCRFCELQRPLTPEEELTVYRPVEPWDEPSTGWWDD